MARPFFEHWIDALSDLAMNAFKSLGASQVQ